MVDIEILERKKNMWKYLTAFFSMAAPLHHLHPYLPLRAFLQTRRY